MKKRSFFNNLWSFFDAREKILNNLKSRIFTIKDLDKIPPAKLAPEPVPVPELAPEPKPATGPEPAPTPGPTKHKTPKLKLHKKFDDKNKTDEKDIIDKMFWNCFKHHRPSFLFSRKDLLKAKQGKNNQLINNINFSLIHLRYAVIGNKVCENENPNNIIDIVEKNFNLNKQQKRRGPEKY